MNDPFEQFKASQKERWAHFVPLEVFTATSAPSLVQHARVAAGQRVLDVACGTGVVSITAARRGAAVTGADLTPVLLDRARENARLSGVDVEWREADVETLPFPDAHFDVVVSQYGHMFAPRPDVAVSEMLRVLRPGGTIAFSTWPPETFIGRTFHLIAQYAPPSPPGMPSPAEWGDPSIVARRLGDRVNGLVFARAVMWRAAISVAHLRQGWEEGSAGPLVRAIEAEDPRRLAEFRSAYEAIAADYFEDNQVRHDYLMTRAVKA